MELLYPFTTMSFQAPLLLLAPFLLWFLALVRSPKRSAVLFPSAEVLLGLPTSLRTRLRGPIMGTLLVGTVVSLSVAAARPQRIRLVGAPKASRNIMLAIDVSPSMATKDFGALLGNMSRLRAVKEVVDQFVSARQGDRLGLVVFGGAAYLQSPLTLDHEIIRQLVSKLEVGMGGEGTAIGDGLGVALKRVQALPAESTSIILLTDGVSNAGAVNPIKAAKVARDLKVKVHTIGIGSTKAVTVIQPGNIFSNLVQRRSEFDEASLKEIADITGGTYFNADNLSGLEQVYQEIDRLERSQEESDDSFVAEELFLPFAAFAALLYALYITLGLTLFRRIPE